jgi:hypothetical protein
MKNESPRGRLLFASFLVMTAYCAVGAGACDVGQNTDSRGHNPGCGNPRAPYCVSGVCLPCNPYLGSDYVCDCGSNKVCNEDFTSPTPGLCIAPPKYGQACSSASDCATTYSDSRKFTDLACVSGTCRQCDPSGAQSVSYNCTTGYVGEERACIAPGYWGVSSATPSTTTAAGTPTSAANG